MSTYKVNAEKALKAILAIYPNYIYINSLFDNVDLSELVEALKLKYSVVDMSKTTPDQFHKVQKMGPVVAWNKSMEIDELDELFKDNFTYVFLYPKSAGELSSERIKNIQDIYKMHLDYFENMLVVIC